MKNIFFLTISLFSLSACGIIGTAVDIVTTPIDILTLQEQDSAHGTIHIAQQQK